VIDGDALDDAIIELVAAACTRGVPPSSIERSASLRSELAIESMSLASIVFELEDRFSIDFVNSDFDLGQVDTVGDLMAACRRVAGC
jgi:acyl carrier protein